MSSFQCRGAVLPRWWSSLPSCYCISVCRVQLLRCLIIIYLFLSWSILHDCIDDDSSSPVIPSVIGFKCTEFIRRNHIYRNVIEEPILNREQRKKLWRQIQKCFVSFVDNCDNCMWTLISLAKNVFFFMSYTCFNDLLTNNMLLKKSQIHLLVQIRQVRKYKLVTTNAVIYLPFLL